MDRIGRWTAQFALAAALACAAAPTLRSQTVIPDCASPLLPCDINAASAPSTLNRTGLEGVRPTATPVIRDAQTPQQSANQALRTPNAAGALTAEPEPPSEFQKYVQQFTGEWLPVFGRALFERVPSTFAPAEHVAVSPDYTLGPGDQVNLRAWGNLDMSVSPQVDASGAIFVPRVGDIPVAGIRFAQLEEHIRTAIGRVYRNFELSVSMGQLRSIQVLVTGHARRPGAYTISALSTLVNAVFASGGPDSHGSMRAIRLMRAGREVARFDLYDLLLHGDTARDAPLLGGDVINIQPVGAQVALSGSVNMPAIYELAGDGSLEEAVELAGGLTPVASRRGATIERIVDSSWQVLDAPLAVSGAAPTLLRNGDIVSVLSVVPRFENAVTLRGSVADPLRTAWRPGMRIRDLIPDRITLLSRDYWRTRNRLSPEKDANDTRQQQAPGSLPQPTTGSLPQPGVNRPAASPPAPATVEANKMTAGSIAVSTPEPENPNKRRAPVERNPLEINWDYAVIERRDPSTLRTNLIPFRLGAAIIDGSEADNLPLQPGDVVTVFSTADLTAPISSQTRYVRLEGEFASAGMYSVKAGETLRDLVRKAGGFTSQAYLFGSEFLRESSRVQQQQRLDDLVNTLERETASTAANQRGSVITAEEAASAGSQISAQRELVQKMRQIRARGRVVLEIDSRLAGVDALPDLPLEDGDVFSVPSRPAFVNVVGSVQNSSSFVYREDKRLGDYLRAAGGASSTGDMRHAFLIRADGSVVSRSWSIGLIPNRFENLALNPGDSIVVPEQINKTTFLKGLKDWSQVFAQFALGAAAINILR